MNNSMPLSTTFTPAEGALDDVQYNEAGLVPAIIQDVANGQVLMLAWMNETSLRKTLETGRTWFWSRSRNTYWCKGETSGDRQYVRHVTYDCDGDTLLFLVEQEGKGACHTGTRSCFARLLGIAEDERIRNMSTPLNTVEA